MTVSSFPGLATSDLVRPLDFGRLELSRAFNSAVGQKAIFWLNSSCGVCYKWKGPGAVELKLVAT